MKTLVRLARDDEIAKWDELLTTNPDGGEIFQSAAMAEIKTTQGWTPEFWVYETSFGKLYATVLTRNLFASGRICYMMRGPGVVNFSQFAEVCEANRNWEKLGFMVKMEPPILAAKMNSAPTQTIIPEKQVTPETASRTAFQQEGSRAAAGDEFDLRKVRDIQPNAHTILVDLSQPEDEILASFRQRARREIRAAIKDEIRVEKVELNQKNIDKMYDLYAETGQRAGFFLRPKSYHENFWRTFSAANEGDLYFAFAKNSDQPIAGAYICKLGQKAVYKDGGSARTTAKHFAHLLQWEIMRDLKKQGVTEYDLHGVPPSDQLADKSHPLAGLAMFKLSFSPNVTDFVGAYDQILNAKKYKKWIKRGQRLHQAWAHRVRKTTLY